MKLSKYFLYFFAIFPVIAFTHVKWFSNFDFRHPPLEINQLMNLTFWGLMALSLASLPALVLADKTFEQSGFYLRINHFLDRYSDNATLIMRIATGAVLLMSWQSDSFIAPELKIPANYVGWFQLLLALLIMFRETTIVTGAGMLLLFGVGLYMHGIFHMLDYVVYLAVGFYHVLSNLKNERIKNLDLPVLYTGLGFSLCWVAFEKLFFPYWGLDVLARAPELTMGLPHKFFLTSTAFVEFTLGYLLIICLLQRPLSVVITLTFLITTSFFGKAEVIGHTILHGALLVFIVKGPGKYYQAPIRIHKSLWLRSAFAVVNFLLLFSLMAWSYQNMAKSTHERSVREQNPKDHGPREEAL